MRTNYYHYVAIIALFSLIACKKSQTPDPTGSNGTTGTTGSTGTTGTVINTPHSGIYLAGSIALANDFSITEATLWRQDTLPVKLTSNIQNVYLSWLNTITSSGKDIYVAGAIELQSIKPQKPILACFWKNGEIFRLTFGVDNASATDISVQGLDIYATVNIFYNNAPYSKGVYFKNADQIQLVAPGPTLAANGIVAKGTDVYVCGNYTLNSHTIGCYWKNGVVIASFGNDSQAGKIALADNGDVYVVGYDNGPNGKSRANVWKNGVAIILPTSKVSAVANGITLDGNDVYVVGTETDASNKTNGVYWKNGVATSINAISLSAIAVSGSDVYVTGVKDIKPSQGINYSYAGCWKNSALTYGEALPSNYNAILIVR
ncbi:MAG: hypothetical protein V4560_17290 [Bacteroidota bacterium]